MLTVIIPSLSNEETYPYLEACIESIFEHSPDVKVIAALNGPDAIQPRIRENLTIVHTPARGQCGAVNQALWYVKTKYVMVSNDDMIYSPGSIEKLLRAVKLHLCVSPTLVEPEQGAPPFLAYSCGRTIKKFDREKWLREQPGLKPGVGIECGFNLPFMTEKEVFETIGGYDEEYDPYGSNSDPDIMYKMMIAGISPKRVRKSLVYHFSNRSCDPHVVAEKEEKQRRLKDWNKNWRYFPRKWGFERYARGGIWYAAKGTRIPTKQKPYVSEIASGFEGKHRGTDYLEYKPEWLGKYGKPVYGRGDYYDE